MPRKKTQTWESEKAIFPTNLSAIMKERGTTQEALAKAIGVKRQTISLYQTGQSTPNVEQLSKIADYFEISADWLLGRSPTKVLDAEETPISNYTGLSIQAIQNLAELKNRHPNIDVINFLLEDKSLLAHIVSFLCDFIFIELKKAPYNDIPTKGHYSYSTMDEIYFARVIRQLQLCKTRFEELHRDDEEFIKNAIYAFLLKHADYRECESIVAEDPPVDEDFRPSDEDYKDMLDMFTGDDGYDPDETELGAIAWNEEQREKERKQRETIKEFLAFAGR